MINIVNAWKHALSPIKKLYDLMAQQTEKKYGIWILAGLFFIEAIFFVPVDPLLILFCTQNNKKSFYYATVSTVASVAGGVAGYFIGMAVWQTIGYKLIYIFSSPASFKSLCFEYEKYQTLAVLIAGFTPIPYKLVTITAGFCRLHLPSFIIYSCIARGARFFLIAALTYTWGKQIKDAIDHYFNYLVVLFTLLLCLTLLAFK